MIRGLWSQLTPEQQKLALEYRGEENIMPDKMDYNLYLADVALQDMETIKENIRIGLQTMHDLEEEIDYHNHCMSNAVGYASK